jgi:copper(I)-binding protein
MLALAALPACGGDDGGASRGPDGELTVQGAFLPEPPLDIAALYFTVDNRTGVDDALVGASTEVAAEAMVHGPGMSMVEDGLPLPAGVQTSLEPGGAHVMLTGVEGVEEGDTVTVTLDFAVHEPITLPVPVTRIGSAEAP